MKSSALTLYLASLPFGLAASLSKRACIEFNPTNKDGYDAPHPAKAITTGELNCTAEKARADGGDPKLCDFKRFKMGIRSKSTINITVSDIQAVLDVAYDALELNASTKVNLNKTILFPYNNTEDGIAVGEPGFWAFIPTMHCYEGMLKDCNKDGKTKAAEVCGVKMRDWSEGFTGQVEGKSDFVRDTQFLDDDVENPWPRWDDAVKKWNEEKKNETKEETKKETEETEEKKEEKNDDSKDESKDDKSAGTGHDQLLDSFVNYLACATLGITTLLVL